MGFGALDINGDGFEDLLLFSPFFTEEVGTRGLIYKAFVWDDDLQEFIGVDFVGFDFLMSPNFEDGYLIDRVHNFVDDEIFVYTLRWEGYRLIKVEKEEIQESSPKE